jgi:hypothetical protein
MDPDEGMRKTGGATDGGPGAGGGEPGTEEVYRGHTEREVAFKLLAAHALVDREFYEFLKADPAAAAASLHIALDDFDLQYLKGGVEGESVEWERIDPVAEEIRDALNADVVVRSLW